MQNSYPRPTSIPTISVDECFRNGWRWLWPCFFSLLVIMIVAFIVQLPASLFSILAQMGENLGWVMAAQILFGVLVSTPVGIGSQYVHLIAARGQRPQVRDLFAPFQSFCSAVGIALLLWLILIIGFLLLFVPGIVLGCRLGFAPLLVVDRKMGVIEAIRYSWEMTRGHAWTVFYVGLLSIPVVLVGLLCFIVGVIPAGMWVALAYASLYHLIVTEYSDTKPAAVEIQESRHTESSDTTPYALVDDAGTRHAIGSAGVTLGRQNTCSIVVEDPAVSRLHARVLVARGNCWVRDEDTLAGTLVNRQRLTVQQQLHVGDQLQVGTAAFRLERVRPS